MRQTRGWWLFGSLLSIMTVLVVACGPAAEPTATTAPARPTATTAPAGPTATTAPAGPTATTAPAQPTATTAPAATQPAEETKLRLVPVLDKPAPNPEAQYGGVFRYLAYSDPTDFAGWESCCGAWGHQVYETLVEFNTREPNSRDEVLPKLAYDWWVDESGETWTLLLTEGVKFSDGEEFTCADAKFTLDTLRTGQDAKGDELRRSPKGAYISRVTEIACPSDYTMTIQTDGPLPSLLASLANPSFAIYPQHIFEGNLELALDQLGPGTGPFTFGSYVPGEDTRLPRNPNYWEQPFPYLDESRSVNIGSVTATHAAFRVGRGEDMLYVNHIPPSARGEMLAAGRVAVDPLEAIHHMTAFHTNWQREPWSDPRFARALRCVIDSRKIVDTVYNGEAFEGPIFPLATDRGGSSWGLTLEEWMAVDPCQGPTRLTNMEQRRQIARDLFAEMGFGSSNPAKFHGTVPNSGGTDLAWSSIMDDISKANLPVDVTFDIGTYAAQIQKAYAGEFDVYVHSFSTARNDPDQWLYEHYYSTSDRNFGKYSNAVADALIDEMSRTLDRAEREELLKDISRQLLTDNAKIVLRHTGYVHTYPIWVKNWNQEMPISSQHTYLWFDQALYRQFSG